MGAQVQSSFQKNDYGTLYLVPTPIGNLDDITLRALNILKSVDLIAAEDTRHTSQLLNHFDIKQKKISLHEHNTKERVPELISKLKAGTTIAQVSDAGMPSISDPGAELVQAAIKNDVNVVSIPGANAGITSLIASGLKPQPFFFYGFLKRKAKEQKEELAELSSETATMIFYESPFRVKQTLKNMRTVFGNRKATLARELTKKFEEYVRGDLDDLVKWAEENQPRGEFVILVEGSDGSGSNNPQELGKRLELPIKQQVASLVKAGQKPNQAVKQVAKENGLVRQDVYNTYHRLGKE